MAKMNMPNLIQNRNCTPIFEWYAGCMRLGVDLRTIKQDMCLEEIGLHAP